MAVKRTRKPMKAKQAVADKQEDNDNVYDVEMILDKRESPTEGTLYYVKWRNYPSQHNTWEPRDNILNDDLINSFDARVAKANKTKTSTPLRSARLVSSANKSGKAKSKSNQETEPQDEGLTPYDKIEEDDEDAQLNREVAPEVDIEMEPDELADEEEEELEEKRLNEVVEEPVKPKRQRTTSKAKPVKLAAEPKQVAERKPVAEPKPARKAPVKRTATTRTKKDKTIPDSPQTKMMEEMDFQKFKPSRLINESSDSKMITLFGKYNGQDAIVMLEKTAFDEGITKKTLVDKDLLSNRSFVNDIYSSYVLTPSSSSQSLNHIKATVVCPATESAIAKFTRSEVSFFTETPDVYSKVVEPFIDNLLASDEDPNRWVYNILDGKSETDRVILNDDDPNSGFMLVQSIKNSNSSTEEKDLDLLAICHRRDIRSLRDLTDKHLTLLRNILTKGTQTLKDKYKKNKGEFRSYIHYHPSFYHFHVHFKMVDPANYHATDRDHLLSTVINNITLNKLYYKKSALTYPLSHMKALYQELEKAERI